jgi:hypothetical protein
VQREARHAGHGPDLADVPLGQLVGVLGEQVTGLPEDSGPLGVRQLDPLALGLRRRGGCGGDVVDTGPAGAPELLPRGRLDDGGVSRGARLPATPDEDVPGPIGPSSSVVVLMSAA